MRLISLDDVKKFLEKETSDSKHDALLQMVIEHVSQRLETAMNRELKEEERTEYFPAGGKVFSLPAYPVDLSQTLTVKVWGAEKTKDVDFYINPKTGVIEFFSSTGTPRPGQVEVTWTGGYEEKAEVLEVPDDMARACLMQVVFEFKNRDSLGYSSVSMPDGSVAVYRPAELLPEVKAICRQYRRIPLG